MQRLGPCQLWTIQTPDRSSIQNQRKWLSATRKSKEWNLFGALLPHRGGALRAHGQRAFAVDGPTVWNSLPDNQQDPDVTIDNFKCLK